MPSKDRRRKEADRLRRRSAIGHTADVANALGDPSTSGQQSAQLDQEPTTSTGIRAPMRQPLEYVDASVGTSAMELNTSVISTPTTSGLRALSIIGVPSTKRTRNNGNVGTPNNATQHTVLQQVDASDVESVADTRRRKSAPTLLAAGASTPRFTSARRIKLNELHAQQIEEKMEKVVRDYLARDWPNQTAQPTRRRSSSTVNYTRCGSGCDCASSAQCQQNAAAFLAASKYVQGFGHGIVNTTPFKKKSYHDKRGSVTGRCHQDELRCAARSAGHRIDYYDCGQFGEAFCGQCGARLLRGEDEIIKRGRQTPCCANGAVHTGQMHAELDELQQPPPAYLHGLVDDIDERVREAFLNNTMAFNNLFAFASTHGEKAPAEQMGGRLDTCKYNGQFSFLFSDLIAPGVRRPSFAQVYTLTPEDAFNVRQEALDTAVPQHVKRTIIERLEALMRANPFGQTFQTVGTKIGTARATTGKLPHFRIALLTDRQLRGAPLQGRTDITIIERADAPTAKQVAVIWVQEDGLPPQISAFWVSDKAGKMRELKSGMPQIDPCCFPLLHPLGTLGWRWFIKKRGSEVSKKT